MKTLILALSLATVTAAALAKPSKPAHTVTMPGSETIAATCPAEFYVTTVGGRWVYRCDTTGVEISFPMAYSAAGLHGTTAGNADAEWTR